MTLPVSVAAMADMSYDPWQFLLVVLAGWINRHQQDVIEYLLVGLVRYTVLFVMLSPEGRLMRDRVLDHYGILLWDLPE